MWNEWETKQELVEPETLIVKMLPAVKQAAETLGCVPGLVRNP
jgi:hypothetical protein